MGTKVVRQPGHRLAFSRTRRLVDDDLKALEFVLDERSRQQMQPSDVNRGFEHRVTRAVEADELARPALVNHTCFDTRTRRRSVDRVNRDLAPGAAISEDDAGDS